MAQRDKKIYLPIKAFNECNSRSGRCPGHANILTDSTYETQEERDLLNKIFDNYGFGKDHATQRA